MQSYPNPVLDTPKTRIMQSSDHKPLNAGEGIGKLNNRMTSQFTEPLTPDAILDWNSRKSLSPHQNYQVICTFFAESVVRTSPIRVLEHFKDLFILKNNQVGNKIEQSLYDLIILNEKELFFKTLHRTCFILVKHWLFNQQEKYIAKLIELFHYDIHSYRNLKPAHRILREWLAEFMTREEYLNLQLFIPEPLNPHQDRWTKRYDCYLLTCQYLNPQNPKEQRQAADFLARKLNKTFKFNLAMYFAHSQLTRESKRFQENPTCLSNDKLFLSQKVLSTSKSLTYQGLANIFLKQTQGLSYKAFKKSLLEYLFCSLKSATATSWLKAMLSTYLDSLYPQYNDQPLTEHLLLRTCNRLIEYILQPNYQKVTHPLTLLTSQGNYLTLSVVLLKIVLLSKSSYKQLMVSLGHLIFYYEDVPAKDCEWVIGFLDTLRVVLTISMAMLNHPKNAIVN